MLLIRESKSGREGGRREKKKEGLSLLRFASLLLFFSSLSSPRFLFFSSLSSPRFLFFFLLPSHLLHGDLALHAGALVRLAVVVVLPGGGQLDRVGLSGGVEVVLVRDRLGVDARGHGVLVEHDVVREAGVVLEGQRVPGLDGDGGRVEDERSGVGAELDCGVGVGGEGEGEPGDAGGGALDEPVYFFYFFFVVVVVVNVSGAFCHSI